jgi:hypothetical protein
LGGARLIGFFVAFELMLFAFGARADAILQQVNDSAELVDAMLFHSIGIRF